MKERTKEKKIRKKEEKKERKKERKEEERKQRVKEKYKKQNCEALKTTFKCLSGLPKTPDVFRNASIITKLIY